MLRGLLDYKKIGCSYGNAICRSNVEPLYEKPNTLLKEIAMFLTKKLILANVFVSSAVLATLGTAAFAYALTDPVCRHKLKDCADKMRNCKDKMRNRSSDIDGAEKA